jgi:hypothetical protein
MVIKLHIPVPTWDYKGETIVPVVPCSEDKFNYILELFCVTYNLEYDINKQVWTRI